MGIRGLMWTLPAGHILYHCGYSWEVGDDFTVILRQSSIFSRYPFPSFCHLE